MVHNAYAATFSDASPINLSCFDDSYTSPFLTEWVGNLCLTITDKKSLLNGKNITANHVSAASKLLKLQFPAQNGLLDTHYLLKKKQWNSNPFDFVQIIFVDPNHWACLSNAFTDSASIDVYDSLPTALSQEGSIVQQACTILQSLKLDRFSLNVVNVSPQLGSVDCGLFAIAMATDICNGIDPAAVDYKQDAMRSHLVTSFEKQYLSPFPSFAHKSLRKQVVFTLDVDLHCMCRQPEQLPMVCCDGCDTWYHPDCIDVHIPDEVFDETGDISWYCPSCKFIFLWYMYSSTVVYVSA